MKIISLDDYRNRQKSANPLTPKEQTDLIEKLLIHTEDIRREVVSLRATINTLLRQLKKWQAGTSMPSDTDSV